MCNPLFVLVEEKLRAFPLSRFLSIKTYLMNEEGKLFFMKYFLSLLCLSLFFALNHKLITDKFYSRASRPKFATTFKLFLN